MYDLHNNNKKKQYFVPRTGQKMGGQKNFFARSARKIAPPPPHFQNRGAAPDFKDTDACILQMNDVMLSWLHEAAFNVTNMTQCTVLQCQSNE